MPLESETPAVVAPLPFAARGARSTWAGAFRAGCAELLRLAVPMIVSRAGLAGMEIADAVMVSRSSPGQFALLSLADGTLGRIVDIFAAFILGGLVLVPRAFGAGNLGECAALWRRSIVPAVALGYLAGLIGLSGALVFRLVGQSPVLSSGAGEITTILGFGYIAALLALGAAVYLEGLRRPAVVAAAIVGANVLNIALNWLLIGGHAGIPALGARGSAIATTIVRIVLAGVLAGFAWKLSAADARSTAAGSAEPDLQNKLGWSAAIVAGIMLVLTASLLVFAGWLGPLAIAILAATFTLNAPVMLIAAGLADATGIRVAAHDGATPASAASTRFIVFTSLAAIGVVLLVFVAVMNAFPRPLAALFTNDRPMLDGFAALIPLASGLLVFDGLCVVFLSALRALRDVVWPAGIEIATLAALVPAAAGLAFGMGQGVRGLIVAAIASAACRAGALALRYFWLTRPAHAGACT